ncbi:MAG: TonB-dependent receptor [Gammaproteobacteria bacterium]|nr:MAG: TonB-dependent receptor [Gammaproteobacteria bacterium]
MQHSTLSGAIAAVAIAAVLGSGQAAVAADIDEIIVSARKRDESLQAVPIAIDVITAEQIQRQGLTNLRDVVGLSPSLQFTTAFSANDPQIIIRGLRPTRGRVNAAVLLDGVDISSESIGTFGGTLLINPELFAMERIEVVKGPQNALYGRSAFNGAISYITRRPSVDGSDAEFLADAGSDGRLRVIARGSGPLIAGTLAGGVSAMYHKHDGFYENEPTGGQVGDGEGYAVAGDLVWQASETLGSKLRLSYSDDDIGLPPWRFMDPNQQFAIPQSAIAAGVVAPGFPAPDVFGSPPATVAQLLNQPGILNLMPGFVPGAGGKFPDGNQPGASMSPDPRTCADPVNGTGCSDYEDGSRKVFRAQLDIDWDLGAVTLRSITHFADAEVKLFQDANAQGSAFALPFLSEIRYDTDTQLFSQELILSSNGEGRINWTVGALFWQEEVDQVDTGNTCLTVLHPLSPSTGGFPPLGVPPLPLTPCGPFQADIGPQGSFPSAHEAWFRDTDHISAYLFLEWQVTDALIFDFEGRYVDEDMDVGGPNGDTVVDPLGLGFNADLFGPNPIPGCVPWPPLAFPGSLSCVNPRQGIGQVTASESDSYFIPKVTLKWLPDDAKMIYFSWAQAAKPAGIAALTGGPGAFDPEGQRFDREEKTTYELGAKTSWLDNALVVNGAVFFDDYDQKQVTTQVIDPQTGLLVPKVENASQAEVFGIELELNWTVTEHLDLGLGYTWLDTEYSDFVQLTRSPGTIAYGGNCTPVTDAGGNVSCAVDFSGNQLEFAPEHAVRISGRYQRPFDASRDWFIEGDASFTDERFVQANNTLALDSYWTSNLRVGLSSDHWEVIAYVDNLFDDDTVKEGLDNIDSRYLAFPSFGSILVPNGARYLLPDPRTYGLRVAWRYGGSR